jgi:hypothetical protein
MKANKEALAPSPTSSDDRLYYSTRKWLLSLHVQAVNREGNLFLTYTVLGLTQLSQRTLSPQI